jgi:hypothetical protein
LSSNAQTKSLSSPESSSSGSSFASADFHFKFEMSSGSSSNYKQAHNTIELNDETFLNQTNNIKKNKNTIDDIHTHHSLVRILSSLKCPHIQIPSHCFNSLNNSVQLKF